MDSAYSQGNINDLGGGGSDPKPEPEVEKKGWWIFRPLSEWGTPSPKSEKSEGEKFTHERDSAYSQGNQNG